MISCLPGSIVYSTFGLAVVSLLVIGFLLLDQILQNFVEALETLVPEAPVFPHPFGSLLQAASLEAAWPPLRIAALRDQAGALQHFQVFGDAGETEVERLGQLRDRGLPLCKTGQDRSPGGMGEGCERDAEVIIRHRILLFSELTRCKNTTHRVGVSRAWTGASGA